jgi:amino acid adenylation domain-containing protein
MEFYDPAVSQKLIWMDQCISKDSAKYNIGGYAALQGELDTAIFGVAIRKLLAVQEAYSSLFREERNELTCYIGDAAAAFYLDIMDLSAEPAPLATAMAWMENDFSVAFEIENRYLFGFKLLKLREDEYFWYAKIHHLIADGWSFKLLLDQVSVIYESIRKNEEAPAVIYRYSDYAREDREYYSSGSAENDRAYWLNEYRQLPPGLLQKLPCRDQEGNTAGSYTFFLPAATKKMLQTYADEHKSSLFHLIISLLLVYFNGTGQQDTIVIGMPVLNRSKKVYRHTSGVFMNLLALCFSLNEQDTLNTVMAGVKQKMTSAWRHQRYQYGNLIKDLKLPPNQHLYDIRVSYEDFDFTTAYSGLRANAVALSNRSETDKLAIYLRDYNNEGFDIRFVYDTRYFTEEMIVSLCNSLDFMINSLASWEHVPVSRVSLLSSGQRQQVLSLSEGPVEVRQDSCFLERWNDSVRLYPRRIAISSRRGQYTYKAANDKAAAIAHFLLARKEDLGEFIILQLPRNEDMVFAMLGCMMAGITYIPLEEDYPRQRVEYICRDTGCKMLLGSTDLSLYAREICFFSIDDALNSTGIMHERIFPPVKGHTPCYIIYTSGSTGTPKGVMISHYSLLDYVSSFLGYFELDKDDIVLQQSAFSFDTSVEEIFPILAAGGRLHILGDRRDIPDLVSVIRTEKVTVLSTNPYIIKYLNTHGLPPSLRILISGGDVLLPAVIGNIVKAGTDLYNTYGPTESTVCATYYKVTSDTAPVFIGKPFANRRAYLLDRHLRLQPPGAEGEIYLGGEGLALGYVNDIEMTKAKFIDGFGEISGRLFRTGDIGLMMPDGNIAFRGRNDSQLKYRGYRIEAWEVEDFITMLEPVADCIVEVKAFRDEPVLVAYVRFVPGKERPAKELRRMLSGSLPVYMIPELWVPLEEFPLLFNGKVDRKALPAIEAQMLRQAAGVVSAPRSGLENRIWAIWKEVLGHEGIGVDDSFFELGGHSLNIVQLANQYYQELGVKLTIQELFLQHTIAAHASMIADKDPASYVRIPQVEEASDYAVSGGQARLWVLGQLEEAAPVYHLTGELKLEGEYIAPLLESSIREVIQRHEILRTVFTENSRGELRQRILPIQDIAFTLAYKEAEGLSEKEIRDYISGVHSQHFDLKNGPLLRGGLVRCREDLFIFHYSMHHIISDGWSMEILGREILAHYEGLVDNKQPALASLRIQYKDYSAWLQRQLEGELLSDSRKYWLKQLSGNLPALELPFLNNRPSFRTYNGSAIDILIDKELTEGLRSLCRDNDCTLFMGLLSVLNTLFYRYTGQNDIIIGTPLAGRLHAELEDQIGFYVNTLPLRCRFDGGSGFRDLLNIVKETTINAFTHQQYPFDRILKDLAVRRDSSHAPLFDVMMILQNQRDRLSDANLSRAGQPAIRERPVATEFELCFDLAELEDQLHLRVIYNTDLYDGPDIIRLIGHYIMLIGSLIKDPAIPLFRLEYLRPEEKQLLLYGFNDTAACFPANETIVSLFSGIAEDTPDLPALVQEDSRWTYGELHERSNQLGHYLRRLGIREGMFVPVCMDRTPEKILAIWGVLKSGAAYVPIDPTHPEERIAYILSDIGASLLIGDSHHRHPYIDGRDIRLLLLDKEWDGICKEPKGKVEVALQPSDLAYLIYTSGSTGRPKGVMIEHASVVNLCNGQAICLGLRKGMGALQFAPFTFDASCYEIFNTLLSGGFLVLPSTGELLSPELLVSLIQRHQVEWAVLPPSFQPSLVKEELGPLKIIVSAGEPLNPIVGRAFQAKGIRLINAYGPTEITVCATLSTDPLLRNNRVTIGRPVPNTCIYILDNNTGLLPVGAKGEIYIGGAGLARGYWNNPGLTDKAFIRDPFCIRPEGRLYKTADTGRWLPDGNIEYTGRMDEQVKIRGYRIEPGEIEQALLQLDGIDAAAVTVRTGKEGQDRLVAYVTADRELDSVLLRRHLLAKLPDYMVPAQFIRLDSMPLTTNNKIDKLKLAETEIPAMGTGRPYVAPRNTTERWLARIYGEFLDRNEISVLDNFFDLGGNSLLLIKVRSELQRTYNLQIGIRELLQHQTIDELAALIDSLHWQGRENADSNNDIIERFVV